MSDWNASLYLKYGDERTRPARDLAGRIRLQAPARIVDLGCGPGNSMQVLRERWPDAEAVGVDRSGAMIESARESFPDQQWIQADIADWTGEKPFDLVFSNAALQWVPDHQSLMPRLLSQVAPGGALAFQVPSDRYAEVRTLIDEVSRDPAWDERMEGPRTALTIEAPSFYYDVLVDEAAELDIWETEYQHVLESPDAIVDWMSSTGLRPYLEVLDGEEQERFLEILRERVAESYDSRADGKVLFPFRRLFVIAYR